MQMVMMKFMEQSKKTKTGYTIVTYRVRLYDRHFEWLKETKVLYEAVTKHFLKVLQTEPELLSQSDFLLLRVLEEKCIGTKEMKAAGKKPTYPFTDFPKVPLYFRRSAINTAIALARKQVAKAEDEINFGMTLYKGMYRDFLEDSIELKLLHNGKWIWVRYPFTGRKIPKEEKRLSPMLVMEKKDAWLHIPVSLMVKDVSTVKERMEVADNICAIYFPDQDVMATAVLLDKEGKELECRYFRGGKQREHLKQQVLGKIQVSEQSRGKPKGEKENRHLLEQLRDINQYYAHSISRQLVTYCLEKNVKVIVVPNYDTPLNLKEKAYLKTNVYHWIGRSIIKKLKYKAFAEGMVVTSIKPTHIVSRCSQCGAEISRYNEGHRAGKHYYGGKLFYCTCGHKGNTARNAAINVGKTFLGYYKE